MRYDVNTIFDSGYIHRAYVNGELVEVSRKEPTPPFATVVALNLSGALATARLLYGHNVIVSEPGPRLLEPTAFTGFTGVNRT